LRFAVNVVGRAEFLGQRFLVHPTRNGNGPKTHLRSELNAQVAETSYPKYGDKIAGPRAAVPQRVEGSDSRTHERSRFDR
jgi:hypothetical protein